jgi:diguanylate cyclase (GGDEF)-like protein/PAS domain S-box-containing protein
MWGYGLEKGGVMGGLLADSMRRLRHIVDQSTQDRPSVDLLSDLSLVTAILDALPDYIWICDADVRETVYISSACEKLLGVGRQELLGDCRRLLRRVHESDRHRVLQARQRAMVGEYEQLYRIVRPDGGIRWIQDRGFALSLPEGGRPLIAGIAEDVTERHAMEQQLVSMAYFDGLTQLANRTLFYDRLAQSLAHAKRKNWTVAVLFIDIDHFKRVNDTAGHHAGDELLQEIAQRLMLCVRGDDTVARLSGHEFAMVLNSITTPADAGLVAEKVLKELSRVQVAKTEFCVTASIGIAIYPINATEDQALMRQADAAMYTAKQLGRNNYHFYSGSAG